MGQVQTIHCKGESFLNVPTSLIIEVVGNWLRVCDVGRLDKALCSKVLRSSWLELLARKELILDNSSSAWWKENRFSPFKGWCLARKARVNEIVFHDPTNILQFYSTGKAFFDLICDTIVRLGVSRSKKVIGGLHMLNSCPRLRRLDLANYSIGKFEAHFIVSVADTLEELNLHQCCSYHPIVNERVVMKALRTLTLAASLSVYSAISLLSKCPALLELRLFPEDSDGYYLIEAAAQYCPKLTVLALFSSAGATDQYMAALSNSYQSLTNLQVVFFGFYVDPTGEMLENLTNCCPHLHALHLMSSQLITDATLRTIATRCADRLTHLAIEDSEQITMEGLLEVAKRCKALVDFSMAYVKGASENADCTIDVILAHLSPHVTALNLSGMIINSAVVRILCERFHGLQHLCMLFPDNASDIHCVPQLMQGLPNLKCLCVQRHDDAGDDEQRGFVYTDADIETWTERRPGLIISDHDPASPFWRRYRFMPEFPAVPREDEEALDDSDEDEFAEGDDSDDDGGFSEEDIEGDTEEEGHTA